MLEKYLKSNVYTLTILSFFVFIFIFSFKDMTTSVKKKEHLFTLQDYFQKGHDLVQDYSRQKQMGKRKSLQDKIVGFQKSCVQIEAVIAEASQSYTAFSNGSAVIIGLGDTLLTAAHTFENLPENVKIFAIGPEGSRKELTILERSLNRDASVASDWAILKVKNGSFNKKYAAKVSKSIEIDDTVTIMGYPQSFGVDDRGIVQHIMSEGQFGKMKRLNPLSQPVVVRRKQKFGNKVILKPEAGAIMMPGASGGPVFNSNGDVIGHYTSYVTEAKQRVDYSMTMRALPEQLFKVLESDTFAKNSI